MLVLQPQERQLKEISRDNQPQGVVQGTRRKGLVNVKRTDKRYILMVTLPQHEQDDCKGDQDYPLPRCATAQLFRPRRRSERMITSMSMIHQKSYSTREHSHPDIASSPNELLASLRHCSYDVSY